MRHKPDIEILGDTVRSALGAKIMEIFPGVVWYRDFVTDMQYPHFFISQLTLSSQEDRRDHFFLRYLMTARYRVQEEPSRNTQLNFILDNIGFQMVRDIESISIGTQPNTARVDITNARYEKTDGVLHFFGNILLQVTYEQAERIKMQYIELNKTIKED
jgi:hypothetical protein